MKTNRTKKRSAKRSVTSLRKRNAATTGRSALDLSSRDIALARRLASEITAPVQAQIDASTTVSIERATLRLLGIDGSLMGPDEHPVPYVNALVERVRRQGDLSQGILTVVGQAIDQTRRPFPEVVEALAKGEMDLPSGKDPVSTETRREIDRLAKDRLREIRDQAKARAKRRGAVMGRSEPLRYVIVATGNIHEDALQAKAAAENGADIIAVIRSTAQSLLDYVPVGITTMGFGGTFATQENFRLMRKALDETGERLGRYIHLTNYSSGLCMPEIAAIAAIEELDMLLNDAMYGILFRDINMQRTFIDQYFSRLICTASLIYIQTGEDNYLTTADAHKAGHHVLGSQFINECFAMRAGLPAGQICLGHAFEMDPRLEDGFLWEVAQAQMIREIFPKHPIKYMPPTKHKSGDFFWSNLYDGMFNLVGIMTGQTIQLLGMATESLHNPMLQDRYWSLKNANYVFRNARHLGQDILWKPGGIVRRRAQKVLHDTVSLLRRVRSSGLMRAIERGWFADVKRHPEGGKGLEGVVEKADSYWNPVWTQLEKGVTK